MCGQLERAGRPALIPTTSMSQSTPFSTRVALDTDARAVRMLFSTSTDIFAHVLVAESGEPLRVVGAGGITKSRRPKPLPGPGITLHVIPPARGKGIARSLVSQLAAYAASSRAQALYAMQKVDATSDAMRAWSALGFRVCETVEHHDLLVDQFEPQLVPLYERLRSRGKIPSNARIIPLYDADLDQIIQLHLAILGGNSNSLGERLRGQAPGSFAPRHSRVLLLGDRVAGFILAHRVSQEVMYVDANVLAPDVRGNWANVWLKLEATRGAIESGIKKLVFTTFDHYRDTRSFTDKLQGTTVWKSVLMYHPLGPSPPCVGESE